MAWRLFPESIPISKRIFDLLLVIPLSLAAVPVLLILALIIALVDGFPIFFSQERPGLHGKVFRLLKFRTMRTALDASGQPLPDGQRLTRLGKWLRASSLDELPEFINVLKGEMSLVGPRPLLVAYLERYSPEQARRHNVLPGITGWAQVNGRNLLSWEDKFKYDIWYVDHWSIGLDLKIIWMTLRIAIKREGINQPGQATSEEFKGNPHSTR